MDHITRSSQHVQLSDCYGRNRRAASRIEVISPPRWVAPKLTRCEAPRVMTAF
jgi:hypothetical protein